MGGITIHNVDDSLKFASMFRRRVTCPTLLAAGSMTHPWAMEDDWLYTRQAASRHNDVLTPPHYSDRVAGFERTQLKPEQQVGQNAVDVAITTIPFLLPPAHSRAFHVSTSAGTALSIGLLVLAAWMAFTNARGVAAGDGLADQVQAARFSAETLLGTLKDAETGQRGYLLTGDPSYLEPYWSAKARLKNDFARLEASPFDTDTWAAGVRRLKVLADAKLAELGATIALRQAGNLDGALAIVRSDVGKRYMDRIRAEIGDLDVYSDARLARARAEFASRRGWAEVTATALLACLVIGWLAFVHRRVRSECDASNTRLEQFTAAFGLAQGMMRDLDGRITYWSEGSQRLYGYTPSEAVGRISHTLLATRFPVPLSEIDAAVRRTGQWSGDLTHRRKDGVDLHIASVWVLHPGGAGSITEVNTDITSLKEAEAALQRDGALLRTIVETAPGLIYAKDRQGRMLLANGPALDLIGKPWTEVAGRTDAEFLADRVQAEAVMATDRRLMETGLMEGIDEVVGADDGQARIWFSTKAPLRDESGKVNGLVGVSVEITERRRSEDNLRQMVNELNHRAKNILSTVQSITAQTLRNADPLARRSLVNRIMALSAVHNVLTRENWEGADLREIVEAVSALYGEPDTARFQMTGQQIRLNPRAAQSIAMGVHELASNAALHGSLLEPSGDVRIAWEVTDEAQPRLILKWTEHNGPPVSPATRQGFGTRLIKRGLAQELGAQVRLSFDDPAGISCIIEAPLTELTATTVFLPRVGGGQEVRRGCGVLKGMRVLVVEDEYLVSLVIEDYLADLNCDSVHTAARLKDAKELAGTLSLDLAFLDVNLAGELSYPAADILRIRGVPFMFVTGYGAIGLPETLRDIPVLVKAFDKQKFAEAISALLGKP